MLLFSFCLPYEALAVAWKLSKSFWSEEDEAAYSNFVEKLCDSKHGNLNRFIKDPKANPLYGDEDKKFYLHADCADLPYLIRAYVAYKLRLPFSYVSAISSGKGRDQRYSRGNRPKEFKDQDYFSSPQKLFSQVPLINSGYFRMPADSEDSDHYPVKIQPGSIRSGTIYYDPDGHVAIVAKVMPDGRIRLIDGHPDQTISKPWFGAKFTRGTAANGGGFKRWRPLRYTSDGQTRRTRNHNIPDYSATDQYQKSYSSQGQTLSYYDYVRARLTDAKHRLDPVSEFCNMMSDLYEDICYRAVAVNVCIEKGINKRPHPGSLPWNIYGTDGLWEEFSTPSRDARLKVAFRDFYDRTRAMVLQQYAQNRQLAMNLAATLLEKYEMLSPRFSVSYKDSTQQTKVLSFNEVCERLFRMSFDPYHSAEYRWGSDGEELALSPDDATKIRFYQLEQRLRHQLERVYNQATPLSMGPEKPPEVSVKKWLTHFLQGTILEDDHALPPSNLIADNQAAPPLPSPSEIQEKKMAEKMAEKASEKPGEELTVSSLPKPGINDMFCEINAALRQISSSFMGSQLLSKKIDEE